MGHLRLAVDESHGGDRRVSDLAAALERQTRSQEIRSSAANITE